MDKAEHRLGRMVMCHLIADTVAELHVFAQSIGAKRAWFQPLSSPHYDLPKFRRQLALASGAIELDRREFVGVLRRQRPIWIAELAAFGGEHG